MTPTSVFDKAQALQSRANALAAGEAGQKEAERVAHRVEETRALLAELRQALTVARSMRAIDDADPIDLSILDDGYRNFSKYAAAGSPSDLVFTTAKRKIRAVADQLGLQLQQIWSGWTSARMSVLPVLRIILLPSEEQGAARERRDELAKLARVKVPSATDVTLFLRNYDLLKETLDGTPDPPEEVLSLLQRLGERPSLTLHDLTDAQIALLRDAQVANQIEVRRRGM